MTTIAYVKDDGFYADSRVVDNIGDQVFIRYENKILVHPEYKYMFTYSGQLDLPGEDALHLILNKWVDENPNIFTDTTLKHPLNRFILEDDGVGLLAISDGTVYFMNSRGTYRINGFDYYCNGTGGPIAECFLRVTGDPQLAMSKAIEWDTASGGDINYMSFVDLKRKREEFVNKKEEILHVAHHA